MAILLATPFYSNILPECCCLLLLIDCHLIVLLLPTTMTSNQRAGSDGRCFLAAWVVSTYFRNVRQKPNLPTSKGNPSPRCSARAYYLANAHFREGRCAPVRAHRQQVPKASSLAAEHRRPRCKQDECTSSSRRAVLGTRHSPSGDPLHLCR